jgi:hypothetical protein
MATQRNAVVEAAVNQAIAEKEIEFELLVWQDKPALRIHGSFKPIFLTPRSARGVMDCLPQVAALAEYRETVPAVPAAPVVPVAVPTPVAVKAPVSLPAQVAARVEAVVNPSKAPKGKARNVAASAPAVPAVAPAPVNGLDALKAQIAAMKAAGKIGRAK